MSRALIQGAKRLQATGYGLAPPANPLFAPALTRSVVPKKRHTPSFFLCKKLQFLAIAEHAWTSKPIIFQELKIAEFGK
jgi:hypothetical protein